MKCPNCAAAAPEGAAECAACGLVFAKWKERREKERREVEAALAGLKPDETAGPKVDPWAVRALAGGIVVAWMAALATYYLIWTRSHQAPR